MAEQQNRKQMNQQQRGNKPFKLKPMTVIYIVLLVIIGYLLFGGSGGSTPKQPITWEKLQPILERHDYESITVVNQEVAEVRIKADAVKRDTVTYGDIITRTLTGQKGLQGYYTYNIGNYEHFDKELAIVEAVTGEHISYKIENRSNAWKEIMVFFGPLLMLIFFLYLDYLYNLMFVLMMLLYLLLSYF